MRYQHVHVACSRNEKRWGSDFTHFLWRQAVKPALKPLLRCMKYIVSLGFNGEFVKMCFHPGKHFKTLVSCWFKSSVYKHPLSHYKNNHPLWDLGCLPKEKKLNFHQTVSPGKRRSSSSGVISALVLHWRWTKTLKKPWLLSPNFHSVVVQIRVKCHFSSVEAMPRESSDPSQEKDSCLSFRLVYCPKMVAKMSSSLSSGRTLNEEDEQDSDCCFCEREAGRGRG